MSVPRVPGAAECPWCGMAGVLAVAVDHLPAIPAGSIRAVTCDTCGCFGPRRSDIDEAINAWNEKTAAASEKRIWEEALGEAREALTGYLLTDTQKLHELAARGRRQTEGSA